MKPHELETLKKDLAFAVWAAKRFKECQMKAMDGAMWMRVFDTTHVPESYKEDVIYWGSNFIETAIPEISTMYEIKVLEYQKEMAEKRLAEIRGQNNG